MKKSITKTDSQSYFELLKDPRWQKKRLKILERDNFTCKLCGDSKTELQIHHNKYIAGKEPWESSNRDLITLCAHCHKFIKELKNTGENFSTLNGTLISNSLYTTKIYMTSKRFLVMNIFYGGNPEPYKYFLYASEFDHIINFLNNIK